MSANSSPERIYQGPQSVPPKRLLGSILDRLQKKDKFGVFAEPVDEKEVPDYYDIIKDPMDFGTMRSRIYGSHYSSLELFQRDIFLICDNAMQYNGKGTVYFRHARAIKEAAERILEDLKLSGVSLDIDEPAAKCRNGGSSRINDRHDSSLNAGSPSETRTDNLDEVSGYLFKASGSIDGRRSQAYDENCRNTYAPTTGLYQGNDSLSTTISGDSLHLVPTGYQMEFPYSKSLARFAADLGPLVWKIAAEKITKGLPPGCPFGPGWVGERDIGGVLLSPSSKQSLPGQAIMLQSTKVPCANGAISASELSALPAVKLKPENQSKSEQNHEIAAKVECQPSLHNPTTFPVEVESPTVFGNSLAHIEKSEGASHQRLRHSTSQPMANLFSPESGSPLGQVQLSNKESRGKLDQMSQLDGSKSKFTGQANLNHPANLSQGDGDSVDDGASVRDPAFNGRGVLEGKTAGPGTADPHVGNVGGLPFVGSFHVGGTFNSRVTQADKLNPMKARMGETGMNTAVRNQHDGRCATQPNRFNVPNASSYLKAGFIAPGVGINDANYQASRNHVSGGPTLGHNLNMSLQQPSITRRDGNSLDLSCGALSQPQSAQIFALQSRSNIVVQKNAESRQHSNSSDQQSSQDASSSDRALSALPTPPCPERMICERFGEPRELREREMLSGAGNVTSGPLAAVPRQGCYPERGFPIQRPEAKNSPISRPDVVNRAVLEQLSRKQNTTGGLSDGSFTTMLPSSDAVTMACEVPSWVPAQQTDSVRVNGKGGAKFQSQVTKNPLEGSEIPLAGVPSMRIQPSESEDPHSYSFGSKKHKFSVPHFLQQPLVTNNSHGVSNQNHQMQLHMQNNALLSSARNLSPSSSVESNFVRQFKPPSHPSFSQASSVPWQYISPQMVAHGSNQQPLALAPDLNMSLPLTKSSFDQSNGNEVQQPDLALQL